MTQKEILEFNKLCAEFLGLIPLSKPYDGAFRTNHEVDIPNSLLELIHSEMECESWYVYPKFHSDWNWIMEVVEAIEKLDRGDEHGKFRLIRYGSSVNWNNLPPSIDSKSPKEAVVQAINQFLIWYNKKRCFCGAIYDGITCNSCGFDASEIDIY